MNKEEFAVELAKAIQQKTDALNVAITDYKNALNAMAVYPLELYVMAQTVAKLDKELEYYKHQEKFLANTDKLAQIH